MNDKERHAILEQVRHQIQTEGVQAATTALIGVCNAKDAPANAKATAGNALLRAAGLFEKGSAGTTKEMHEMSLTELKEMGAQIERDRAALLRQMNEEETAFD